MCVCFFPFYYHCQLYSLFFFSCTLHFYGRYTFLFMFNTFITFFTYFMFEIRNAVYVLLENVFPYFFRIVYTHWEYVLFLYLDTIKHSFYHNLRSADFVFCSLQVFVAEWICNVLFYCISSERHVRHLFLGNGEIIFSPLTWDKFLSGFFSKQLMINKTF